MDLPIMASLWIGGSLSYIEQLCLKSFVDHGHRTILYTYGDVGGVPPGVEVMDANLIFPNDNYITHKKSGSPAVHADAFRYRMIELQNVVWVDADMLCMRPWDFKDQWIFGWEKPETLVCNAVLGLPRFSKTLSKLNDLCRTEYPIPPWASDEVRADLEARHRAGNPLHVSEMKWGVWGPAAVTHFLFETGEMQYAQPQMAFFPILFKYRRQLLERGRVIEDQLTSGCYGVHLWNRRLRRRLVTNERGFPADDSFLGRALKRHGIDPRHSPIPDDPPASLMAEAQAKLGRKIKVDRFAYLETGQHFDVEALVDQELAAPSGSPVTTSPEMPASEAPDIQAAVPAEPVSEPVSAPLSEQLSAPMSTPTPEPMSQPVPDSDLRPAEGSAPMARRPIDPSLPTVAGLWIGGTLSYLEQLCLLSFRDFGHRTVLYTYHGVDRVPAGIELRDANEVMPTENYITHKDSASPALHSDVFRYHMIHKTGFVWIDADVLCMRPWRLESPHAYGWEKHPRKVCGAVLGMPKDSAALNALIAFCHDEYPVPPWLSEGEQAELRAKAASGTPVHVSEMLWGVWGPTALTHFLRETGEIDNAMPEAAFYPVTFKDRAQLTEPGLDLRQTLTEECFGVHLWNRRVRRRLVTDEVNLPHPDCVIGQALLRHRVDPRAAPIPDSPPPGHQTQKEILDGRSRNKLERLRAMYVERQAVYAAIADPSNHDVMGEVTYELGTLQQRFGLGLNAQPAAQAPQPPASTPAQQPAKAPAPEQTPNPTTTAAAADPDQDDAEEERGDASTNPQVTSLRPRAMDEMPVMKSVQSAEYQTTIDGLEGRTSNITGYLKTPDQPIDNSKILIVTSMKNEAPFILEWVAYHKAIGVDHFLVYTNDCTDNTNEMLDRLQALGHLTRVDNPWDKASGKKPQHVALKDALTQPALIEANWILTIDCDEFVNIHVGDGTFADLFKAANYPNVVSFTWKFFGNKGVEGYEDRPITEQFTACAPEFIPKPRLGWGFKSMFHKTSPYTRIGVHRPLGIDEGEEGEVRWVNGSGRAMPDMLLTNNGWRSTKRSVGYRLATLNHYILRSAESFLVKRDRGRINHTEHDQGIDYWMRRNYATETDDRIHARLPMMHEVLSDLKADPVLAEMHDEAVAWHRDKIQSLLEKPDYKQLFDDLTKVERPDALDVAKQAEEAVSEEEAEARAAREAAKPKMTYSKPGQLTTLKLVRAPDSASATVLHEPFNDARSFAGRNYGFLWEGRANAMMFAPRSKRLVVTFDNLHSARQEGQRWPWGMKALYEDLGCSVLGVLAVERNWYRDDFVHDSFEALRDQGFFEQFDEVLFYGTSMGGFAALVYQACAPGSNVLAIAPQSTMDRAILPKEDRWGWTQKLDWTGRFNDASKDTDLAKNITIIADPYFKPDYDQVSRLSGDNITWLKTPFMGHQLPNAFHVMEILKDILVSGVGGTLTPDLFYKLFRARRDLPRYQHDLLMEAERRGKIKSAIRVCEYTLKKRKAQNIKRTLGRLKEQLAEMEQKEAAE